MGNFGGVAVAPDQFNYIMSNNEKNIDLRELLDSFDNETGFNDSICTIKTLLCHYQGTVPDDPDDLFNTLNLIDLFDKLRSIIEITTACRN
jgi:hypothetical protein